jgi:formylglycine-generating enzyme required for sulfatase activity
VGYSNGNGELHENRADDTPSINGAMHELRRHARSHWLDMARDDQSHRWREGAGIVAEEYFSRVPELRQDREDSLVLICGEIQLRRELGDDFSIEEYERRFPDLAADIRFQFDVDHLLSLPIDKTEPETGRQLPSDTHSFDPELDLPGYEFVRRIGGGAFGSVFQARQLSLNRFVAIKALANFHDDSKLLARQQQEAEILARLSHPNVVHIYEVINHRGWLFLVMEYVDGAALDQTLDKKPLPPREAAQLVCNLAETVEAVHAAGVLHRDLKPSNVLLSEAGQVKISDFSLAKVRSDDPSLTVADDVLGTPSYMAPEQARGEAHCVGPEADVYSLGAILYELLTGRPPFLAATVLDTLALIRDQDPVPPRQLQPSVPRDLQTICLQCLQKSPEQRCRTAADLRDDLKRFLTGQPILARQPRIVARVRRLVRRHKVASMSVVAALIVAAALAATRTYLAAQQRRQNTAALVNAVATADVAALPQLMTISPDQRVLALPMIRAKKLAARSHEPAWVNLSIVELTLDAAAATEPLLQYLPSAKPEEVAGIVDALDGHVTAVREPLWQMLLDDDATAEGRLRLACLAARVAPEDPSWSAAAPPICRALVREHPIDMAIFTNLLEPVQANLVPALTHVLESSELTAGERHAAISIAARFITDEADSLVRLAVDSQPDELAILFRTLEAHRDQALPLLKSAAATVSIESLAKARPSDLPRDIVRSFDRSIRRSATAAIALWRLGDVTCAKEGLAGSNPSFCAWMIELLIPLGVSPRVILQELSQSNDSRYRQSLILALGQLDRDAASKSEFDAVRTMIVDLFRTDRDAGVHAACRWLLSERLSEKDHVARLESQFPRGPSSQRQWFHGANGHLFNIVHVPAEFRGGSPPTEFWREEDEVPSRYQPLPGNLVIAVSAHEVTVAQYQRFQPGVVNTRYSATTDSPVNNVTWYDAARYCRWLSEKEGIDETQMVYPPTDEIGPAMRIPTNWLTRTGYRLPIELEFEYVCRAGTSTSRYCGAGRQLLRHYVWHLNCSDDHAWPVAILKPNAFGLYDILGNVAERCHQTGTTTPGAPTLESKSSDSQSTYDDLPIGPQHMVYGGDFGDIGQNIRVARRVGVPANAQWGTIGFRVVRTLRVETSSD